MDSVTEYLWCAAFAVLGRLRQRRPPFWKPTGKQRILVVAPHPDDEVCGCAGTLLLHAHSGDSVTIAYVTDGSRSRAGGLGPEEMRRQRKMEAGAAAKSLQVDRFEWLGMIEGKWEYEQVRLPMLALLQQTAPELIYAPSRVDFHPEHRKVAHALSLMFSGEGIAFEGTMVRVCQHQVPLTSLLANRVVDCSAVAAEIGAVLSVYKSQSANLSRALRMRRYAARFYGVAKYAEEFWQMPVEGYCRLHDAPPDRWLPGRFRGIRYRSFSDPLSYAFGWRARRRLQAVVPADKSHRT